MGVPTGQVAFTDRSGHKKNTAAFQDELNTYFVDCKFTKGWPEFGVAGNYRPLIAPFRFHFVSMDPVVIVGVAKEDPTDTNPDYLYTGQHTFIGTNYINDAFQAGTTFPYRPGAKVVWFSPAVDHDLHDIDLASRTARIALAGSEFLTISVDGSQLVTSRQ